MYFNGTEEVGVEPKGAAGAGFKGYDLTVMG
jgi:hypothetical protein